MKELTAMYEEFDRIQLKDGRTAQIADVLEHDVEFIVDIDDPQPDGTMRWITDEINVSKIKKKLS
jgi:hypothetical protein